MTTDPDANLALLDERPFLPFGLRFVYCVAIPNVLVLAALVGYTSRLRIWKGLRDYFYYDGPAAGPDPLTGVVVAGTLVVSVFIAICFFLLSFLLTMAAASYPWQRWFSALGAGFLAIVVVALPIGAAWIYLF